MPNPLKKLLAAALDGGVTPEEIGCQLEAVAVGRLVVEERKGLIQRVEPALLEEFCRMEPIVCGHLHRLHGLVDKVADHLGGVARPGPVVALRVAAERLRPLAMTVRLLGDAGRTRRVGACSGHASTVGR